MQTLEKLTPTKPVHYLDDQEKFNEACNIMLRSKVLGFDVETELKGKPAKVCLMQVASEDCVWLIDVYKINDLKPFGDVLANEDVIKVIHCASFEQRAVKQFDMEINNIFDTLTISRKLRNEHAKHSLKIVCARELERNLDKKCQVSDWRKRPLSQSQLDYAALDAEVLIYLYQIFNEEIEKAKKQ